MPLGKTFQKTVETLIVYLKVILIFTMTESARTRNVYILP